MSEPGARARAVSRLALDAAKTDAPARAVSQLAQDAANADARARGHAPDRKPFGSAGVYMHVSDAPHLGKGLFPGMYRIDEEVVCRRVAAGNLPWNWNVGLAAVALPPASKPCDKARLLSD